MQQSRHSYYNRTIYSADIRDTNAKTTEAVEISGYSKKSLIVKNGLNQNAAIQIQGSADKITFVNIGTATTVNTATNAIIGVNEVAELADYFPYLRATVTAAVQPASGTITVQAVAM